MTGWIALLQNLSCGVAGVLLLALLVPERPPWTAFLESMGTLRRERAYRRIWAVYVGVILVDIGLTSVDHRFTAWVGTEFTRGIRDLEGRMLPGGLLPAIQRLASPPLDVAMTAVYITLFPQAIIASLLVFTFRRDGAGLRQLVAGFAANYVIALPFYLLFPVREAWAFDPSISLRMDAVSPLLMEAYRPLSGIDNCFPSLHASLAGTAWLVARDRRGLHPRLAPLTGAVAVLTVLSTFYLGIHWVTDGVAGILLAVLCHRISRRFAGTASGPSGG